MPGNSVRNPVEHPDFNRNRKCDGSVKVEDQKTHRIATERNRSLLDRSYISVLFQQNCQGSKKKNESVYSSARDNLMLVNEKGTNPDTLETRGYHRRSLEQNIKSLLDRRSTRRSTAGSLRRSAQRRDTSRLMLCASILLPKMRYYQLAGQALENIALMTKAGFTSTAVKLAEYMRLEKEVTNFEKNMQKFAHIVDLAPIMNNIHGDLDDIHTIMAGPSEGSDNGKVMALCRDKDLLKMGMQRWRVAETSLDRDNDEQEPDELDEGTMEKGKYFMQCRAYF